MAAMKSLLRKKQWRRWMRFKTLSSINRSDRAFELDCGLLRLGEEHVDGVVGYLCMPFAIIIIAVLGFIEGTTRRHATQVVEPLSPMPHGGLNGALLRARA